MSLLSVLHSSSVSHALVCDAFTLRHSNTIYTLCGDTDVSISVTKSIGLCICFRLSTFVNNLVWHDLQLELEENW